MKTQKNTIPSRLPNGKANPEYTKKYRKSEKGKEALAKYRKTEKFKESQSKYRNENKAGIKKKQQERRGDLYAGGSLTCVDCGQEFSFNDVVEREYQRIGLFGCLCDICC